MLICTSCKVEKPLEANFREVSAGKGKVLNGKYYSSHCKECDSKRSGIYNKKNRQKIKERELQTKYSLSLEEYLKMVEEVNNTCPICGISGTERKPLVVDHCHTTLKVRGLLCYKCNMGLGYLKDSSDNMIRAAHYLRTFYGK